jgi:hypothetical protein
VVGCIRSVPYRPEVDSPGGPSWLRFLGHSKDSLWSWDVCPCALATLRTRWVLVGIDQGRRRVIACTAAWWMEWRCAGCSGERFAGTVCQNTSARIRIRSIDSTHGKPIFGVLGVTEIEMVPYVPFSRAPQRRRSPVGEGPTQGGCWLNFLLACDPPEPGNRLERSLAIEPTNGR